MLPSLVTLPAPSKEYLDRGELARWLEIDEKTLRKYVRAKRLPSGKPRLGGARHYWTREAAAMCKWILDNLDRFNGDVEPSKRRANGKNIGNPPANPQ